MEAAATTVGSSVERAIGVYFRCAPSSFICLLPASISLDHLLPPLFSLMARCFAALRALDTDSCLLLRVCKLSSLAPVRCSLHSRGCSVFFVPLLPRAHTYMTTTAQGLHFCHRLHPGLVVCFRFRGNLYLRSLQPVTSGTSVLQPTSFWTVLL